MMSNDGMDKVIEAFGTRDNFLITAHVNPEGDSIGSQLAVYRVLEKLGKKAVMVDHDKVPDNLKFLPGSELVAGEIPGGIPVNTAIVLDCPVAERAGSVYKNLEEAAFVINIDHHVSNEFFGDINWVEPDSSSVGEMIFNLTRELGIGMDKDMAAALYAAIVTDTGMFNYSNTSKETHLVAGELIGNGADPGKIHREIYEKKSVPDIRLLGMALTTLCVEADGRLAHMSLTRQMYREEGVERVSTDEFINFPRSIKGVEVAVFFKEIDDALKKINVSFRSSGTIDVNKIASRFGGGGHPQAAGCLFEGSLEGARVQVLAEVKKALGYGI
ncbi:MAG: bifunctional oligoribonuclease/PAP phosphatase NrnA [Candidatus Omnitrophota bacterium]|nr:bifunctional oligoribonuclease/PAP phosphatase NrnA [Candidatus Omnitrophota bacterium]